MSRSLIRTFWNCGDSAIIDFAMDRARLNREERNVLHYILDECFTQEYTAEHMNISTRKVQQLWASACDKLLLIDWVVAYAKSINSF